MNDELFYLSNENATEKLDEALTLLATGLPLEDILAETGEDTAWLYPLLEMAADVRDLQQAVPLPGPEASLGKMLAHADTLRNASPQVGTQGLNGGSNSSNFFRGPYFLMGLISALGLAGLITWSVLTNDLSQPTAIPAPSTTNTPIVTPQPAETPDPETNSTHRPTVVPALKASDTPTPATNASPTASPTSTPARPIIEVSPPPAPFDADEGDVFDETDDNFANEDNDTFDGEEDFSEGENDFDDRGNDFEDTYENPDQGDENFDEDKGKSDDEKKRGNDDDKGHGNDEDGCDEDNPGNNPKCNGNDSNENEEGG